MCAAAAIPTSQSSKEPFTLFRVNAGGFSEEKKKERTRGLARYLLESILQLGE